MEENITLIKDLKNGLKNINVIFIILEVEPLVVTKSKQEVQIFKVADQSACINVSVWDKPCRLLIPGDIVKLTKGYASTWRNCLNLYTSKHGDIQKIGEFTLVFNEELNMSAPIDQSNSTNDAEMVPLHSGTSNEAAAIGSPMLPPNTIVPLLSLKFNNIDRESNLQSKSPTKRNPERRNPFSDRNPKKRFRRSRRGGKSKERFP